VSVEELDGIREGSTVGVEVGKYVGGDDTVGITEGTTEGTTEGATEGAELIVGDWVGNFDIVGTKLGV